MRIRETALFRNTVEGKDSKFKRRLEKELAIVKKFGVRVNWDGRELIPASIAYAFTWEETPQKWNFWFHVDRFKTFPE